jgi:transcriptional regulator with XRE-family HTH domain
MSDDIVKDIELIGEEEDEKDGIFTVSENFGLMIKHYRKIKNYSLKQLEELSGVSASYVNRLERGERKSPSITKILQLAEALGIPNSMLVATIIKEPQASENVTLSDLFIKHEYLLNGEELNRKARECLLRITEYIARCDWSPNSKVRELYVLSELIDEFKQAI